MSNTTHLKLFSQPLDLLHFLAITLWLFIITPLLAAISIPFRTLTKLATYYLPSHGKLISYFDAWLEEDFVTSNPKCSVVITLTIQKDISVNELRTLFQRNVLDAQSSKFPDKLRYPELKQYLTTFMGFRVWKNEKDFQIENHIVEGTHDQRPIGNLSSSDNLLANIHQTLMNLRYHDKRSPWEVILIRNPNVLQETILACRLHHVLADAKSILKLFVECLGKKKLKTAEPQQYHESLLDKFQFYLFLPLKILQINLSLIPMMVRTHFHPFRVPSYWTDGDVKTFVAFTPKLSLAVVKSVAKQHGVTGSAVVISIIMGAIRKCRKELGQCVLNTAYILPKANHPEGLTNHLYFGFLTLPTNQGNIVKRLKECNNSFVSARSSNETKYRNLGVVLGGIQIFPLSRLLSNQFAPCAITNIAGEEDEFCVGKGEVVDFRLSVGTTRGVAGVVFCAFSYRGGIRIAVVAKKNVLRLEEVNKLATDIGHELKLLDSKYSTV